jgi:sugar/nucleoside kinase (ribokinase family)
MLVLGELNPGLVLRGDVEPAFGQVERLVDGADLVAGGSGAIVACGAARLGLRTAIAGVVGDDLFGRFMLDALAERGVTFERYDLPDAPGAKKSADGLIVDAGGARAAWFKDTEGNIMAVIQSMR